jgi:hypothetical protein
MDLEETEARNDCAGEGQHQFNQPTDWSKLIVRQLPTSKDVSMEAEKYPLLETVTGDV